MLNNVGYCQIEKSTEFGLKHFRSALCIDAISNLTKGEEVMLITEQMKARCLYAPSQIFSSAKYS